MSRLKNDIKGKKIVCLGGGIGTVNLIKGLKDHTKNITVVVSMADEGGSSGRLRRLYNLPPTGDMVSCMSALVKNGKNKEDIEFLQKLLTYRFPGNRYGKDNELSGHKLGNLIFVAMQNLTDSFEKSVDLFQKTFGISGTFLPATTDTVSISAKTIGGKEVHGEENIDLGKYNGKKVLDIVKLHPKNAQVCLQVLKSIEHAQVIIAGPGDLYTTILPVLIVPGIKDAIKKSKANKIFILNIANKPFETKNYTVHDYIKAVSKHLGSFPFKIILANSNFAHKIPQKYHYKYVELDNFSKYRFIKIIKRDLVEDEFPIYHNSTKLAKVITENI